MTCSRVLSDPALRPLEQDHLPARGVIGAGDREAVAARPGEGPFASRLRFAAGPGDGPAVRAAAPLEPVLERRPRDLHRAEPRDQPRAVALHQQGVAAREVQHLRLLPADPRLAVAHRDGVATVPHPVHLELDRQRRAARGDRRELEVRERDGEVEGAAERRRRLPRGRGRRRDVRAAASAREGGREQDEREPPHRPSPGAHDRLAKTIRPGSGKRSTSRVSTSKTLRTSRPTRNPLPTARETSASFSARAGIR